MWEGTLQTMAKVRLLGELGKRFGRHHEFDVSSAAEAIRALCANFPNFERELVSSGERGVGYKVLAGHDELNLKALHDPSGKAAITIAPVVSGAGGDGLGQILLGAALIAVSWWNPMGWAAAGSFLSQATLYSVGTSMMLGGVAQMIAPTPSASAPTEVNKQPSYTFNGAVNTTAQGHPVPVGYGRMIVGSAVISAGIDVDEIAI
jgi:predicted phage tail protein